MGIGGIGLRRGGNGFGGRRRRGRTLTFTVWLDDDWLFNLSAIFCFDFQDGGFHPQSAGGAITRCEFYGYIICKR